MEYFFFVKRAEGACRLHGLLGLTGLQPAVVGKRARWKRKVLAQSAFHSIAVYLPGTPASSSEYEPTALAQITFNSIVRATCGNQSERSDEQEWQQDCATKQEAFSQKLRSQLV